MTFQNDSVGALVGEGTTRYEEAVDAALTAARNDMTTVSPAAPKLGVTI